MATDTAARRETIETKRIHISEKRQITIPKKFFIMLGFDTEAECVVRGNELVLRPARENRDGAFSEEVLADLIREGYGGEELLCEFKRRQRQIRPAIDAMLKEAERAAASETEYMTYQEVFDEEDNA